MRRPRPRRPTRCSRSRASRRSTSTASMRSWGCRSRSRRARCSPSWAPTGPGRRRCSGPSRGCSRTSPRRARSGSAGSPSSDGRPRGSRSSGWYTCRKTGTLPGAHGRGEPRARALGPPRRAGSARISSSSRDVPGPAGANAARGRDPVGGRAADARARPGDAAAPAAAHAGRAVAGPGAADREDRVRGADGDQRGAERRSCWWSRTRDSRSGSRGMPRSWNRAGWCSRESRRSWRRTRTCGRCTSGSAGGRPRRPEGWRLYRKRRRW